MGAFVIGSYCLVWLALTPHILTDARAMSPWTQIGRAPVTHSASSLFHTELAALPGSSRHHFTFRRAPPSVDAPDAHAGGWTSLKAVNYGSRRQWPTNAPSIGFGSSGSGDEARSSGVFVGGLPSASAPPLHRSVDVDATEPVDRRGLAAARAVEPWRRRLPATAAANPLPSDVKLVSRPILVTWN